MLKKFLLIFFLFLFAMQFVLAGDTEIKIKTPEFTEIHLTILDPDADYSAYAIYKQTSNAYGDATFIYSGEELIFDLMVVLKKSDKTISSEKYRNNYIAGEPVYLEIIPEGYELKETPTLSGTNGGSVESTNITNNITNITEINQTTDETNLTSNETLTEEKSGFLGAFLNLGKKDKAEKTDEESKFSFKWLYYIIGVALLAAVVFFIFRYAPKRGPIKIPKLSEVHKPKFSVSEANDMEELISDAEKRIKSAQRDLENLKKLSRR